MQSCARNGGAAKVSSAQLIVVGKNIRVMPRVAYWANSMVRIVRGKFLGVFMNDKERAGLLITSKF